MRLAILSTFALLAACNNPDNLPPVSQDGGATPPAPEQAAPEEEPAGPAGEQAAGPEVPLAEVPAESPTETETGEALPEDGPAVEETPMDDIIVGGPCSYETDIVQATVIESDEDGALFDGPDGEFYVSEEYISPVPAFGETLTIKRERITQGTCTPQMYERVD